MRLTGAALRIRKRGVYKTKPLDRVIYGSDKTGKHLQPPRAAPVAPNAHFSRSGALEEAYNRPSKVKEVDLAQQPRGRPAYGGTYTPQGQAVPLYIPKYNEGSATDHFKLVQLGDSSDVIGQYDENMTRAIRKMTKWWKDNWETLDLIDPQKWALFPGDVVKVVNPSHPDNRRFGIVKNIYMPHGLVWVDGLNSSHAQGQSDRTLNFSLYERSQLTEARAATIPFNYRDVKYLKHGRSLINVIGPLSQKNIMKDDIPDVLNDKFQDTMLSYSAWESNKGEDRRSHREYILDTLDENGLLETLDLSMSYGNFSLKNFENMDWQDLQAERVCRESQLPVGLPIKKNLTGSIDPSKDSKGNSLEMGFDDLDSVIDYGAEIDEDRTFEEAIREKFNVPVDDVPKFYYRQKF
ncbi:unnamed protein product [Oikopleura dioica]|uniref:Uncharacterized protein n=1 Tax=Oikopleura dioica TaxID=34765 RepID=E4X983_OIKDI|nr:unnamed protein product [Oikopleura dioica]